jgi:hypothetical protein
MRKPFIPIMAIAVIAMLSGCASNTTPASNPRPGWTKTEWDRALKVNGRLARADAEQHPLFTPYIRTI